MSKNKSELPPLEAGIMQAMKALDRQIARDMLRTPAEVEEKGWSKSEPYLKRVEIIAPLIMNALGDDEITLDSLIIMARSMSKTLQLVIEDLGSNGLGKARSAACDEALRQIINDSDTALRAIKGTVDLM